MKIFKYLLLSLSVLLPATLMAEEVPAISYNPSRLGQFKTLRATQKGMFRGGLQVNNLNIGYKDGTSQTTVTLSSNQPRIFVLGDIVAKQPQTDNDYNTTPDAGATIDMQQTATLKNADIQAYAKSELEVLQNANIRTLTAKKNTQNFISAPKVKVPTATGNYLKVKSDTVQTYMLGTDDALELRDSGWKLGPNTIPVPTVSGATCKYVFDKLDAEHAQKVLKIKC